MSKVRRLQRSFRAAVDPLEASGALNDADAEPPQSRTCLRSAPRRHDDDAAISGWSGCLGQSTALQRVVGVLRQLCLRISNGRTPTILLDGETGTGKGLIAKHIHYNTARRDRAFVEVNCASLPPTLIESELFGHDRGAFTDARSSREGLFEAAEGGTLFLDEIDALPLELQAKLLTVIEDKKVRRIGGRQQLHIDVQIIAATHENLAARARDGVFRSDLYYRLNVATITLPPLRQRGDDAVLLAEAFIDSLCREYDLPTRRLADDARAFIARCRWPGNVRELRNQIERIVLLENDDVVRAEHFIRSDHADDDPVETTGVRVRTQASGGATAGLSVSLPPSGVPLEQLEREVIRQALEDCGGNVSRTARYLSITRQTLMYRIKKHKLSGAATEE